MKALLKKLGSNSNRGELVSSLVEVLRSSESDSSVLQHTARETKQRVLGRGVWLRGLIELSNRCVKDCYYCGIRKSMKSLKRYELSDEIVHAALRDIVAKGYGSAVIQAGERVDPPFILRIEELMKWSRSNLPSLAITLSLGEQTEETYQRWFDAGATRYLLRIETSSEVLYSQLHPSDHSFGRRLWCLENLKKIGYQVGTGVMIGLPGQTLSDLAQDLLFFREREIDMIGMGPYIPHAGTPAGEGAVNTLIPTTSERLSLSLKMIALARLLMPEINIASTTALQTLHPKGRELGLQWGANVLMPNCTPATFKTLYGLYDGKPCLQDSPETCHGCLLKRVQSVGEEVLFNQTGTSRYFLNRKRGDGVTLQT